MSPPADACISGLGPQVSRLKGAAHLTPSMVAGIPFRMEGEHPLPLPGLLSLCALPGPAQEERVGWSREDGAGLGLEPRAAPWSVHLPLSSPAAVNKYQTLQRGNKLSPHCRENSRDKLSC